MYDIIEKFDDEGNLRITYISFEGTETLIGVLPSGGIAYFDKNNNYGD